MLFRGNFARCLYNFSHSSSVSKKQYEANFDKLSSVFSFFFIIIWVFFWFLFWCWIYTIINIRTSINLMVLIINFSPSGVNKYQIESTKMLEWQKKNCGKMCSRCASLPFIIYSNKFLFNCAHCGAYWAPAALATEAVVVIVVVAKITFYLLHTEEFSSPEMPNEQLNKRIP